MDGPSPVSGRIEVNEAGEWGTVCNDSFDDVDAAFVCKSLGFRYVFELSVKPHAIRIAGYYPDLAQSGYTLSLQTVQTMISWHLQKPTDLALHCLALRL